MHWLRQWEAPRYEQRKFPYYMQDSIVFQHPVKSKSKSKSHIAIDGQSVCLGVEPKSGTFDQRFFFFKVTVLSFWGRPL
jgi:hypothetical protein